MTSEGREREREGRSTTQRNKNTEGGREGGRDLGGKESTL